MKFKFLRYLNRYFFEQSVPVNRNESYRPFFIVGTPRSGNTLLRRILYIHPDVHIPPETYVIGNIIKTYRTYHRVLRWPELVYLTLAKFEFDPEFETFEMSLGPLARELIQLPPNEYSLAYLIDAFYRYHAALKGKTVIRWGDKTPLNTFYLDDIIQVFPDARFICMIRDGVDVVASLLETGLYSQLEDAAHRWLAALSATRTFSAKHPGYCLEVKYESLVQEPVNIVNQICEFIGITFQEEMVNNSHKIANDMGDVEMRAHHAAVKKPIFTDSIAKGRQRLSSTQKADLERLIGAALAQFNYLSPLDD